MLVVVSLWHTVAMKNSVKQLSELVREKYPQAAISIVPTSGLCSFYAEDGGLLMGYEIN